MQTNHYIHGLLKYLTESGFTFIRIKTKDKRPEGKWSNPQDRITAEQVISRIAKGSNYGIVPPDGYFILDFDSDEAYQRSIEKDAIIQESLIFKTPRGYHVVFKDEGIEQGASHTFLGQGVDIRAGNKGYVVGPGSIREDGRYEYLSCSENGILDAPDSLISLLRKPAKVEVPGKTPPSAGSPPQAPVQASIGTPEGQRSLTVMERAKPAKKHWQALKALDKAVEGNRNDTISKAACGLGSLYADADQKKRDEVFAKLIGHADRVARDDAEIREFRTTARNQWEKGSESPAMRDEKPDNSARYRMVFQQFDSHEFEQALSNLNIFFRWNEGSQQIEFWIEDDGTWEIPDAYRFVVGDWFVPDKKTDETMMYLLNRYFGKERGENVVGVTVTQDKYHQWIAGIAGKTTVNPFRDWIDQCELNPNLEGLTLENWLNPWLENRDSELNRWTARAIMIAIVQNVYGDPQPCRVIPVLRGEKGIGKTTLVSHLIPEEFRYHFGQFHVRRKSEMVGSIVGKYLCEFGELDGMKDAMVSGFKEFIGNLVNTSRLPWERRFLDYRNQALIIGTSNPERNVPNDEALRSRLVFMDLQKAHDPKDYLTDRLSHLYAQARVAVLEGGERITMIPEHLEPEQIEASEESVIVNETLQDKLDTLDIRELARHFLMRDVMKCAGFITGRSPKPPPGAQKAVLDWLKEMGVGTKKKDRVTLGPKSRRGYYYQMSPKMERIRDEIINKHGKTPAKYGFGFVRSMNSYDQL